MRHPSRVVRALFTLLLTFPVAPALAAQEEPPSPDGPGRQPAWSVEVTPFVGAFVPLAELFEFSATGIIPGTVVPAEVTLVGKQKSSLAMGGRVSGWFNARLGVEGTFTYAFSDLDVTRTRRATTVTLTDERTVGANVWTAAVRVLYRLAAIDRSAVVLLGAGPVIVSRGGDAFDAPAFDFPSTGSVSGTTDLGGVIDLGVRIDASSRVAIRLDAEAYMYSASLSFADPVFAGDVLTSNSKFQTDLVLSAGLAIGL